MTNSNDESYFLNSIQGDKSIYGILRDSENNSSHEYELINQDNTIKFHYLSSKRLNPNNSRDNFFVESIEKDFGDNKKEVKIIVYKNNRKKNIECQITLLIENSEDFFPNQILYSFCHGRLHNTGFKIDNGNPLFFKIIFKNNFESNMKLSKKQTINTALTIKQEKINYKQ